MATCMMPDQITGLVLDWPAQTSYIGSYVIDTYIPVSTDMDLANAISNGCAFVWLTPGEWQTLAGSGWDLSLEGGALIAAAVLGVWFVGWAFGQIRRLIEVS